MDTISQNGGAAVMAWFSPLTREHRARIRKLLARRKERAAS